MTRTALGATGLTLWLLMGTSARGHDVASMSVDIRGYSARLLEYGPEHAPPVIVSSGDGGWIHLAPHVAEVLAAHGYRVLGFDSRAYLEAFTGPHRALSADDVKSDYARLAAAGSVDSRRPILLGVSEGAGLSILAATDPLARNRLAGVIALGASNTNELAWRWRDAVIYLTHGVPREPLFTLDSLIGQVAPVPFALIHSTHDEFSPLSEVEHLLQRARQPWRLWVVPAADHRFSDNLAEFDTRLLEALDWTLSQAPH